jgi:hypothetical protein
VREAIDSLAREVERGWCFIGSMALETFALVISFSSSKGYRIEVGAAPL